MRRRRTLSREAHDVYRIFDATGRLLYVGCSTNAFRRVPQHKDERQPWWPLASTVDVTRYPDKRTGRAAEAAAILTEQPLFNTAQEARALRRFGDAIPVSIEFIYDLDISSFRAGVA